VIADALADVESNDVKTDTRELHASGRPTYPKPITPTVALRSWMGKVADASRASPERDRKRAYGPEI
jgi:hypothetical protein